MTFSRSLKSKNTRQKWLSSGKFRRKLRNVDELKKLPRPEQELKLKHLLGKKRRNAKLP